MNANHRRPVLASVGEAEGQEWQEWQEWLDEPCVRRHLTFGSRLGHRHCPPAHRVQLAMVLAARADAPPALDLLRGAFQDPASGG